MKVAVVIPNWNGADYLVSCLRSLEAQTLKPHIIVVDNGSTDGSVETISRDFPKIELLKFDDNAGFSGGVNRGLKPAIKAGFDYVALFNNDAVADKYWLQCLVEAMEKYMTVGIVTGKFMRMDKKYLDSTGDQYSTWGMPFPRGRNQTDSGQFDDGEYVFGATGGASLYRVAMLKDIGIFDEDFFAYFEDVDISFRAQLRGWRVWYQPTAKAYHHVSATSAKMGDLSRYHSIKNFILTYNKNMPGWLYWRYKPFFLYQLIRMLAGSLRDGKLLVFIRAFLTVLRLTPSTLQKRHQIQGARSVSLEYINSLLHKGKPPKIPSI